MLSAVKDDGTITFTNSWGTLETTGTFRLRTLRSLSYSSPIYFEDLCFDEAKLLPIYKNYKPPVVESPRAELPGFIFNMIDLKDCRGVDENNAFIDSIKDLHKNKLGEGNFKYAWRVWHKKFGNVALVTPRLSVNELPPNTVKRMQEEMRVLHGLHVHDNVVKPLAFVAGEENKLSYIVGLCELNTLSVCLKMKEVAGKPITPFVRMQWAQDVLRGLAHLHANRIAHRDLKPGNVLLTHANGRALAKIADLGLMKQIQDDILQSQSLAGPKGTPSFMAPEVAALDEESDKSEPGNEFNWFKADVWSVGALLLCIFHGAPKPFASIETRRDLKRAFGARCVPPELADLLKTAPDIHKIVASCLDYDPAKRPTVESVLDRLSALSQGPV